MLQQRISPSNAEDSTALWYKHKYLGKSLTAYMFSKTKSVNYPVGLMPLAMGMWPGPYYHAWTLPCRIIGLGFNQ